MWSSTASSITASSLHGTFFINVTTGKFEVLLSDDIGIFSFSFRIIVADEGALDVLCFG